MPDIFDEVEEDLRADQMRRLLRRYGGLMLAALVLVVLGVAGWQAWQWRQDRQAAAIASRYDAAAKLAAGPSAAARQQAIPLFADIARSGGHAGYRTLARLQQAALLAQGGDLPAASALWDQIQSDPGADPLLRDLAGLQWLEHHLDQASPAELASRAAPLAQPDNPFHGLAREAQALVALRQGHDSAAREQLTLLSRDPTAPDGVRQRANSLPAQMGQAAAQAPPGAKGSGS